ncbi:MAG TPA: glutamate-5-semialdehyde dehydrogenase [Thermodesulfovibrio thiophilus]|nr:glutamate-5-semialdehyde dehydrogenase [Thermodesulfovibrio thiophilus]
MEIKQLILNKAREAKEASRFIAKASTDLKNQIIMRMADYLKQKKDELIEANKVDVRNAMQKGISQALIDRLTLTEKRIAEMIKGLEEVVALSDPVGEITKMWLRPNGMQVGKMRVPIGVIGVIYEARPNVTVDVTGLCLKAGNAVVLRGGSEAINSNIALVKILKKALKDEKMHDGVVTYIDIPQRQAVLEMIKLEGLIDLIIPRGGEGLIRTVTENSRIPVLKHYKGVCHIFVDREADLVMAEEVCFNAKVQRPATCNAMETMLVDEYIAKKFLPKMLKRFEDTGVEIRGCSKTKKIYPNVKDVTEEDYYREYLDLILNIRVVKDIDEAIGHITKYGSAHSDAIITENYNKALRFLREVDSSSVFVNASTRLNDGYQFGLGAEIGISTDKIHARGPMGLEELTCTKFIVLGNGQIRQ